MTRHATAVGYAVIALFGLALELMARRTGRVATFGEALALALRRWPLRLLLEAGWLWVGWHLFVRVEWR